MRRFEPPPRVPARLPLLFIQAHRSDLKQQCLVSATGVSLLETNGRNEGLLIRYIAECRAFGHYDDEFQDFS
jgi:hypothetical protein